MTLYCGIEQSISTVAGVQYSISYDISNWSSWTASWTELRIGSSQGAYDLLQQSITGNGSFSHNFTATGAVTWVLFYADGVAGGSFEVTNIDVPGTTLTVIREGGLAQFIAGEARTAEAMREWLNDLGHMQNPYLTPYLTELERDYGVIANSGLTEADRRNQVAAVKYKKPGRGVLDNLQLALDRAFPDAGFVVYHNDPPQDPAGVTAGNLLADGDMEDFAVTPPWAVGNSATLTKDLATVRSGLRSLRVRRNLVNNPYAEQDVLTVGKEYRFQGWAQSDGNAYPTLLVGGQLIWQGTLSGDWEYFDETAIATSSQLVRLRSTTSTGSEYTHWDDVKITETGVFIVNGAIYRNYIDWVVGCGEVGARNPDIDNGALCGEALAQCGENHGNVKVRREYPFPSDQNRWPFIFFVGGQARYTSALLDGNMERSDVLAWTVHNGATLSKQTTDPVTGSRFLRIVNVSLEGAAEQTILTVGNTYRAIGWFRGDGTSIARVLDGPVVLATTTNTVWTKFDVEFTALNTDFRLWKDGAGSTVEFDDVQVVPQTQENQMEAGEALAQCGEMTAKAGSWAGQIVSIDPVEIPEDRQDDLERLILSIKPMHSWALLFVDYV